MGKLNQWKKAERAKIKIKAKKKLPKGLNVTDTTFKSKRIVIPEQLTQHEKGEIHTAKKLNVEELLAHLRHYNSSMRKEGVSGLTELVTRRGHDLIKLHLPRVLDGVLSLVIDSERAIRRAALNLTKLIISKVTAEQLEPHFPVMRSYMSCAMTHIDSSIREDSLLLLDILLIVSPKFMVKKAGTILPNFLDMISRIKDEKIKFRTLSDDISNNVTSVQWRIKVFSRLTDYFSVIAKSEKKGFKNSKEVKLQSMKRNDCKLVKWSDTFPLYVGEHLVLRRDVCYLPCIFGNENIEKLSSEYCSQSTEDHENTMKLHVGSLMPILFEAWVEIAPPRGSSEVNIISQEAVVILQYVINTLQHLWDYLQSWDEQSRADRLTSWFKKKFQNVITKAFLPGFPYTLHETIFNPGGKSIPIYKEEISLLGNTHSLSMNCIQQNLSLCYLFGCLYNGKDVVLASTMLDYLVVCLETWSNEEYLPLLEKVLKVLLLKKNLPCQKNRIMEVIMKSCQTLTHPENFRSMLFSIVCDFVIASASCNELRNLRLEKWVSELSCLLLQPEVSVKTVQALASLCHQNNDMFMSGLKKRSRTIANSFWKIKITRCQSSVEGKKLILEMLFFVADADMFNLLKKRAGDSEEHELLLYINSLKSLYEFLYM